MVIFLCLKVKYTKLLGLLKISYKTNTFCNKHLFYIILSMVLFLLDIVINIVT